MRAKRHEIPHFHNVNHNQKKILFYKRESCEVSAQHGVFYYGGMNGVTTNILFTWPEKYAFVGGLP